LKRFFFKIFKNKIFKNKPKSKKEINNNYKIPHRDRVIFFCHGNTRNIQTNLDLLYLAFTKFHNMIHGVTLICILTLSFTYIYLRNFQNAVKWPVLYWVHFYGSVYSKTIKIKEVHNELQTLQKDIYDPLPQSEG
jgi:hypothetical protein